MVHSVGDFSPPGKCDRMNDMHKDLRLYSKSSLTLIYSKSGGSI